MKNKLKKWLIIIGIIIIFIIAFVFVIRPNLSSMCEDYNTPSVRSGSCQKGAPFFCKTVYYPPSCEMCQDSEGCGF